MDLQFGHLSSQSLLEEVAKVFKSKNIFVRPDRHIIFVCGGNGPLDLRTLFLQFANTELTHLLRTFLAEAAAKDLITAGDPAPLDLTSFEEQLAEISDCVLIFPESPGSIAEVGYFSSRTNIAKKTLVVADASLQSNDSFIVLGPFSLIDDQSAFKKTIWINPKLPDFSVVKERLEKRFPHHNRQKFEYKPYKKMSAREKFYVLFELIRLFGALNRDAIQKCIKLIFGGYRTKEINRLLSVLLAAGYIERKGEEDQYFVPVASTKGFFSYDDYDVDGLIIRIADYFKANEKAAYALLNGLGR